MYIDVLSTCPLDAGTYHWNAEIHTEYYFDSLFMFAQYVHLHEINTDNKWQMGRATRSLVTVLPYMAIVYHGFTSDINYIY